MNEEEQIKSHEEYLDFMYEYEREHNPLSSAFKQWTMGSLFIFRVARKNKKRNYTNN